MRNELPGTEQPLSWCPATLNRDDWLIPAPDGPLEDGLADTVNARLWQGTGFVVLRGLDLDCLNDRQCAERCAHLAGQVCAPAGPRLQRSAHELLTASTAPALPRRPPDPGSPPPPTPSGDEHLLLPHMDRGEAPEPPRLLALLCIRPAAEGGESLLASGPALHDRLAAEHPEALRELHQDFSFGRGPGFDRVRPVFRHDGPALRVHYNRYWIDQGQAETGRPFTPGRRTALRAMETLLHDPALVMTLPLRRGDLLLVNNSAVLHGRTPFEDRGGPGTSRCYARVWAG
ncbi:TauD/TfdA family dioxygenase [Streptomyces sp. NPDC048623]|uniref:TauD/TfdA family dioxygenase n=1 Tax=Streptomyces sp. NPDC048623 TaxID=3155761 RepID=UPI0034261754